MNYTDKQIDEVVNKVLLEVNEDFLNDFWTNYEAFNQAISKEMEKGKDYNISNISLDFAAFKTARDHCVKIFKRSLKELLCKE